MFPNTIVLYYFVLIGCKLCRVAPAMNEYCKCPFPSIPILTYTAFSDFIRPCIMRNSRSQPPYAFTRPRVTRRG